MKWTVQIGVLLILLTAVLAGCGTEQSADVSIPGILGQQEGKPDKTNVDVYWDATYSMQGYTTITAGNAYRSLPDNLEDVGNSMGETKFFRFGETVQPLEGREHRRFSEAGFYNETITAIHTVIDTADTEHLSIIVTDLFESDADWSNVAKKIKDKYFAQHMAVAVVGIKNPFNGDVFDVGLDNAKFNYDSGNDTAKYRPFYLLIMGHENQVKAFIQRWKDKGAGGSDMQYMLLSENLMDEVPDLSTMEIKDSKNIFADEKLKLNDKRMKEFGVDAGDEEAQITAGFAYKPVTDGCKVDMKSLKPVVRLSYLEDGEWKSLDKDQEVSCTIQEDPAQSGYYLTTLKFTPDKTLEKDKINLIYASIEPGYNGFTLPDWVKTWNMENSGGITPDNFDGSKTINFLHLAESLKASALDAAKPSLANMVLLINY